jgi:hypothetical protein
MVLERNELSVYTVSSWFSRRKRRGEISHALCNYSLDNTMLERWNVQQ